MKHFFCHFIFNFRITRKPNAVFQISLLFLYYQATNQKTFFFSITNASNLTNHLPSAKYKKFIQWINQISKFQFFDFLSNQTEDYCQLPKRTSLNKDYLMSID